MSPSDLTVLSGSPAAPRESKCQLSYHIQAVLIHMESFCIVVENARLGAFTRIFWKFSLHCWAMNKWYLLRGLGLCLWEGSNWMSRSQTQSWTKADGPQPCFTHDGVRAAL